jgi:hypothetical protein
MVVVDFPHYADGSHTVGPPSFSHQFATTGPVWPAGPNVLWFSLKRQWKNLLFQNGLAPGSRRPDWRPEPTF